MQVGQPSLHTTGQAGRHSGHSGHSFLLAPSRLPSPGPRGNSDPVRGVHPRRPRRVLLRPQPGELPEHPRDVQVVLSKSLPSIMDLTLSMPVKAKEVY